MVLIVRADGSTLKCLNMGYALDDIEALDIVYDLNEDMEYRYNEDCELSGSYPIKEY